MHDSMTDCLNGQSLPALRKLIDEQPHRGRMIRHLLDSPLVVPCGDIRNGDDAIRKPDPLDLSGRRADRKRIHAEQGPLYARRSRVEGEDCR